jgi:1,4-dihydroxy-2-naphthoate octaprenyltransferase
VYDPSVSARALRSVLAFIRLGRPQFLIGGFLLYGLGAAVAAWAGVCVGGAIDHERYLRGQLAITAAQLMTHYCNDYFDLEADRANATPTRWSGGSRVLPGGELPPAAALIAAVVLALVALAVAARLAFLPGVGPLTVPLLVATVILSWEYSAPPLRLHSRGLGELEVALVVACMTPLVGYYLQAGRLAPLPFLVVAPLCCLQVAMLLAIEFPDAAGDAAVGKRTLVVRYGPAWAARAYQIIVGATYLFIPIFLRAGLPPLVAGTLLLTSPVGVWQIARMRRGAWRDPARWESVAFFTVALFIGTTAALLVAFLLAPRR